MSSAYIQFDAAILAHINWLMRFKNALQGIDRDPFDLEQIGDDSICEFGRWLYVNPASFPNPELFERTKSLHKLFHKNAAVVGALIRSVGEPDGIRKHMDELDQVSSQLVGILEDAKDYSR